MAADDALKAFRAYNFEGDERWVRYRLNLEVPPGADEAAVVARYKAKWYQREVDPSFDPALARGAAGAKPQPASQPSSQPTGASATRGPASSSAEEPGGAGSSAPSKSSGAGGTNGGSGGGAAGPGGAAQRAADGAAAAGRGLLGRLQAALRGALKGPQDTLFVLHALLLALAGVLALASLLPMLAPRGAALLAWRGLLQVALLTHGYKVYLKSGLPARSLAGVTAWLQSALPTTDGQYAMLALMLLAMARRPMLPAAAPYAVLAAYHTAAFAGAKFGNAALWKRFGAPAQAWLGQHQRDALQLNALTEIGVGFLLVAMLLSAATRNLPLLFLYWSFFLRMRYVTPDAAAYHRQAWEVIDARAQPVLASVPMLRGPLAFAQRWFTSMGRPQAR